MKLAAAIILAATIASAAPRHVLIALPVATWEAATPAKRDKIKTFLRRFADPTAQTAIGVTRYVHTASGTPVYVSAFWTQHLERYAEKIDAEKVAAIKAQLSDNNIRMVFTDDPHGQLAAWGLEAGEATQ